MVIRTQAQAKQFFIDRILFQAQKDRVTLSESERYMLGWNETDEGFEPNKKLIDDFEKQTTREEYEAKIFTLVKHAHDSDVLKDPAKEKLYHAAYRTLNQGDHYLLVMIKQALRDISVDRKPNLWLRDKFLLIVTGLGLALVPFFISIYFRLGDQWSKFLLNCIYWYIIPFAVYSYATHMTSRDGERSLGKIIFMQIGIVAFVISTYVYLIVQFHIIDIASHPRDHRGFDLMISAPLLVVSVIAQDFALKHGIVYANIANLLKKVRGERQK